jgi:hypothetical protein
MQVANACTGKSTGIRNFNPRSKMESVRLVTHFVAIGHFRKPIVADEWLNKSDLEVNRHKL